MEKWPVGDLCGACGESLADPYLPSAHTPLDPIDRAAQALRARAHGDSPQQHRETTHEFTRRLDLGSAMYRYSEAPKAATLLRGQLESVADGWIFGWAWDPGRGNQPVTVEVLEGETVLAEARADRFREDLKIERVGEGAHAFAIPIPEQLEQAQGTLLRARVKGTQHELVNSPFRYVNPKAIIHHTNFKLDPRNFRGIFMSGGRMAFDDLRVDPTDNCNANCVYCPIHRSTALLEPEQFNEFLDKFVERIERLQFGCGQEPTLHPRLTDFFKVAAAHRATIPYIQMVTNGMLLHKHDLAVFRETEMNYLLVSMDSPDDKTTRKLRPGTSVPHITRNIEKFRKECPDVLVAFSIVVSSPTVDQVPDLIRLGQGLGLSEFVLREVHDFSGGRPRRPDIPENVRQIRLPRGRFTRLREELVDLFPDTVFRFIDEESFENPELNLRHRAARHSTRGFEPVELQ